MEVMAPNVSLAQIMNQIFEEYLHAGYDGSENKATTILSDAYGKQKHDHDDKNPLMVTKCRRLLGKLIQLIDVRFDIACAISKISQNMSKAQVDEDNYNALMRVVKYLYANKDLKLQLHSNHFKSDSRKQYNQLRAFMRCCI
jgi:hypothetical protein